MPRFHFVAVDSAGSVHDGAINAPTETDARNKLASNGLAVRMLEELAGSDAPAVNPPRRTAPAPLTPSTPPVPARAATQQTSQVPFILSLIALVVAIATAAYVAFGGEKSHRLASYDFGTPEAAFRSMLEIQGSGDPDLKAAFEVRFFGAVNRERLASLRLERTARLSEKRAVLFIEYEMEGRKIRDTITLEFDEEANGWKTAYVSPSEISRIDPSLAAEMQEWSRVN
jgi:hypothetical protein